MDLRLKDAVAASAGGHRGGAWTGRHGSACRASLPRLPHFACHVPGRELQCHVQARREACSSGGVLLFKCTELAASSALLLVALVAIGNFKLRPQEVHAPLRLLGLLLRLLTEATLGPKLGSCLQFLGAIELTLSPECCLYRPQVPPRCPVRHVAFLEERWRWPPGGPGSGRRLHGHVCAGRRRCRALRRLRGNAVHQGAGAIERPCCFRLSPEGFRAPEQQLSDHPKILLRGSRKP